ncbi:helix-turn-helix domain-containing protein [Caulobacter sp. FWC2]|uniref:helix-turn-helix domain-containing protein n=1 Tax=Caulobacter sp. FWC2 TaxID=69664 RepID=UPI00130414D2|nr:helix-turn-helix transcriptional regulator [Caulobacter sp. FWC2]
MADYPNAAIGLRLLRLRQAKGLTQAGMADAAGLGLRTYQNYERGEREVSATAVRNLYRVFGVDPVWLLDGGDTDPRDYAAEVDFQLLTIVHEEVERRLAGRLRPLEQARKVELIMLIYRHFVSVRGADPAFLDHAMRLVA